jgi:hypothetical protein
MLHRRVAEALEQVPVDAERAGLLAYHWEQASEPARAVDYLLRAGDHARLLYAAQEASDYYRRALAILEQQGDYARAAHTWMKLGLTCHNAFDFSPGAPGLRCRLRSLATGVCAASGDAATGHAGPPRALGRAYQP